MNESQETLGFSPWYKGRKDLQIMSHLKDTHFQLSTAVSLILGESTSYTQYVQVHVPSGHGVGAKP